MRDFLLEAAMKVIAQQFKDGYITKTFQLDQLRRDRESYMDTTKEQWFRDAALANALARLTAFGL